MRKETYDKDPQDLGKDAVIAWIATVYGIWLIYAAGVQYLLLSMLLYAPGTFIYVWARKENKQVVFTAIEKLYVAAVFIGAVVAIVGLKQGWLSL